METLPPHLRPSAPAAPTKPEQKIQRELTENERRIARERKQSDAEYLALLDAPPDIMTMKEVRKAATPNAN